MQDFLNKLLSIEIYPNTTLGTVLEPTQLFNFVLSIFGALAVVVIGYIVAGWAASRIRKIAFKHKELDDTLFSFFANIARYIIIGLTLLIVLTGFGVQTTSIVAVIGAAGLAIGLALQGTLSNLAAGVMIVLFRPFRLGDFIETNGIMGTVEDITLNYTIVNDPTNLRVIVPNANVWGNTIKNYSANGKRRAEWVFGVSYSSDLKVAEQVIRDTILSDPRSLPEPEPFIQVNNLGDFSVDFWVRVWVNSEYYFEHQADMKRKVKEALDEAGINIPFPTTTMITQSD